MSVESAEKRRLIPKSWRKWLITSAAVSLAMASLSRRGEGPVIPLEDVAGIYPNKNGQDMIVITKNGYSYTIPGKFHEAKTIPTFEASNQKAIVVGATEANGQSHVTVIFPDTWAVTIYEDGVTADHVWRVDHGGIIYTTVSADKLQVTQHTLDPVSGTDTHIVDRMEPYDALPHPHPPVGG